MSTTIDEVPAEGGRGAPRPGGGYDQPLMQKKGKFELYSWVFMRISGILLLFMALYHLYWWNIVVGVEHLSADLVLERWNQPLWRLYNVALAAFALLHGLNGARYSIEDYVRKPQARKIVKAVVYGVVLLSLAWGIFALMTYDFSAAARFKGVSVSDKGTRFNTDLLEAWELANLLDLAEVTALSAVNRTESRGAHMREDYQSRDDANWLKHTFVTQRDGQMDITYKPVTITQFQPKERVY